MGAFRGCSLSYWSHVTIRCIRDHFNVVQVHLGTVLVSLGGNNWVWMFLLSPPNY